MFNLANELHGYETDQAATEPSQREQPVDVGNRDSVLDFTNRYLESYALPKNIDAVHNVTAAVARYKGPRIVRSATLESFVTRLVAGERA